MFWSIFHYTYLIINAMSGLNSQIDGIEILIVVGLFLVVVFLKCFTFYMLDASIIVTLENLFD